MLVELWPTPKVSKSLSLRFGKPLRPLWTLFVWKRPRRPVRILCPYAWCPTSQTIWSSGVLNVMEGHRQFDHPEAGPEVSALFAHDVHDELAQLVADLLQVLHPELTPQIGRLADSREVRAGGIRLIGHGLARLIAGMGLEQT